MEMLSPEKIAALATLAPAVTILSLSERRQRLLGMLRNEYRGHRFILGHRLEHLPSDRRAAASWPGSIMSVAASDPILAAAGLRGETFGEFGKFFELSENQTHAVSCDCGGMLDGIDTASRLERSGFA